MLFLSRGSRNAGFAFPLVFFVIVAASRTSAFSSFGLTRLRSNRPLIQRLPVTFLSARPRHGKIQEVPDSFEHKYVAPQNDDDVWRSLRSIFAALLTASMLMFHADHTNHVASMAVPPSQAQVIQAAIPPEADPSSTDTHMLEESELPQPDGFVSPDQQQPALLEPIKLPEETNVLDETWALIDKYYLDRTFNGQDWKEVRDKYIKQNGKNKNDDKMMKLVNDMVKSLGDKYSRVLDAKQYAAIQKFDLIGVGVTLMPNADKEIIVGAPPIDGSASSLAGLKSGDFITAINGVSTKGRTAFDIIDQVSEKPNAETITFTVRTPTANDLSGEGFTRDVTMKRTFQEVKDPILYKISETRKDGTVVGYIRIFEFNALVKGSLEKALTKLEEAGANAFVLDLRGNPGGAFQSAVEISSLFFEDRVATNVVDSNQAEMPFKTSHGRVLVEPEEPIAIWTDGGSASASEVFAGSMHDNCRAIVMGDKSFGKGLIQAVYGLKNGAGLVLTVAKYVTPNGTEIQGQGITPDISGKVAPNIPGLSTDTSKVDFADISNRLGPAMCKAPQ